MPSGKDQLAGLLGKGEIKRGRGVILSTEAPTATVPEPAAATLPEPDVTPTPAAAALQEPAAAPEVTKPPEPSADHQLAAEIPRGPAPPPVPTDSSLATTAHPAIAESAAALSEQPTRAARGSTAAGMKNRGYAVHPDLAHALKVYAAVTERKIYDVMNEALKEYLERHPLPL
jgi:hypothetical protein